ncbi:MAG: hypothetical protein KAZ88_14070 [Acidimicrobiia bacterium]|nr:hypothetical protein [Acidimicrobiia bacterium]
MIGGLLNQTATLMQSTTASTDAYGSQVHAWTNAGTFTCYVEQTGQDEVQGGQDTARASHKLWFLPPSVVRPWDRIEIGTVTYEVIGEPQPFTAPFTLGGDVHHFEAELRRVQA